MAPLTQLGHDTVVTVAATPTSVSGLSNPSGTSGFTRGAPVDRYLRGGIAALTLGAAGIHFAMAPDHFAEWWLFGVFFVASAWVQLGIAAAVVLRPSRRLFQLGFVVQSAIVVLWVVSRTSGLPIGPDHWTAEAVAPVDSLCSGFELVTALGFAALLVPGLRSRVVPRELAAAFVGGVAVLALGLTSFALTPTGLGVHGGSASAAGAMPGMSRTGTTGGKTQAGGAASSTSSGSSAASSSSASTGKTSSATSSTAVETSSTMQLDGMTVPVLGGTGVLAGAAVPGCAMKHMTMPGHMVGACTDAPVTAAQKAAAESLVLRTRAALVNLPNLKTAYAAGYQDANISGPLYHVTNYKYLTDGKTLDPSAIESLVYFKSPSGTSLLLGAMYVANGLADGPLVGGALTSWHSHTNLCVNELTGTALNPGANGTCAPGSAVEPTGQMLHVWAVPYDGGPFAELDAGALTKAITGAITARGGLASMS